MFFFRKKFQFIYKFLISKLFMLLYGKIYTTENFSNEIIENKIKIDQITYKLLNIPNGIVYTDYVEHVAVIKKNEIIKDVSYQQINGQLKDIKFNTVIKKGTPRFKKKIEANVFSMVQGASGNNNYFHWLFDIVPRLLILDKILSLKKIDYFYLPEAKIWQLETLSIFDITEKDIINSNKYRHIECKNLYATSHPWYFKGQVLQEAKNLPEWIVIELFNKFIKFKKKFECNDRIFIDRRESKYNHCQITNDIEIKKYLLDKGFSIYKIGELSFFEQIYLFNNAKTIIGAHGAAFANLIFCEENTTIIDIIPEDHPNTVDQKISMYKKLDFRYIKTNRLNDNEKINGDIYLPISRIKNLI